MKQEDMLALLARLIACHSPPGDEAGIEPLIRREFEAVGAEVWQDGATNLYARIPGDGPKVMVVAHKDEIGMIVTHVLDDGRLRVRNMGGSMPWKYGEGPVDILATGGGTIRAILSVGSTHTPTGPVAELISKRALTWDMVTLFTGLTPAELKAKGVHPGCRAVVARERKQIQRLGGDFIASYTLDDRMGLVSMIAAMKEVARAKLPLDLYFVAASGEEIGFLGAIHAAQRIQPEVAIALDTSPVVPDVQAEISASPILWYGEGAFHLKHDMDTLLRLADELGFGAQPAVYLGAASDVGGIKRVGPAGRTVAFGFARDNSHGYEIAHAGSLVNVTRLLVAFLKHLAG